MSYYNPLQNTNDSHYSPYENIENESGTSIGSALLNTAKSMLIFQAAYAGARAVGGVVSKSLGKGAQGGVFGNKLKNISSSLTNPTVGDIVKNSSLGKSFTAFAKSTPIVKAAATRKATLAQIKSNQPWKHGMARVSSAFKDPTTLAATLGGVFLRTAVPGTGTAYMLDRFNGRIDDPNDKKAWYDVPGQVSNAAKWFASTSVSGMVMGGAIGPTAGLIGSAGTSALRKAFSGQLGRSVTGFMGNISKSLPDLVSKIDIVGKESILASKFKGNNSNKTSASFFNKLMAGASGVYSNIKNINNAFLTSVTDNIPNAFKTNGTFRNKYQSVAAPFINAIRPDEVKNVYKAHYTRKLNGSTAPHARTEYGGLNALEFLDTLAANSIDQIAENSQKIGISDEHLNTFRQNTSSKLNFLDKILPHAKRIKNKDVVNSEWLEKTVNRLSNRFDKKSIDKLTNIVMDMDVGKNVFNIDGRAANLNSFSPLNALRKITSPLINKKIRIPLPFSKFEFTIGDITTLNNHIHEEPTFDFFKTKDATFKTGSASSIGNRFVGQWARSNNDMSALHTYTSGGKWMIFGQDETKLLNTGQKLRYGSKTAHPRKNESQQIAIDYARDERNYQTVDKRSKMIIDRIISKDLGNKPYTGNSIYRRSLDRLGIGIPRGILNTIDNVKDFFSKPTDEIKKYASMFFNHDYSFDNKGINELDNSFSVIDNIVSHTNQVVNRVIKSEKAKSVILKHSPEISIDNLNDSLINPKKLLDEFNMISDGSNIWPHKHDVNRAYKIAKSYPDVSKSHFEVKRLGGLGEMTGMDKLQVSLFTEKLNSKTLAHSTPVLGTGNGFNHPLLEAIPELEHLGLITSNEASALKVHAKLTSLIDSSKDFRNLAGDELKREIMNKMRANDSNFGFGILNDIHKFIDSSKLRRSKIKDIDRINLNGINKENLYNNTPYYSSGGISTYFESTLNTVTDVISDYSIVKKDPVKHFNTGGSLRYLAETTLKTAAVVGAYRILDTAIAVNPVFDGTILDSGITGAAADVIAGTRLASAKLANTFGISSTFKYMEGLMPGSMSTLPGFIAGAAAGAMGKSGPLQSIKAAAYGAIINRIANPFLPDMRKSYDQLQDEYSGKQMVPFKKSPFWLMGPTPWTGSNVEGHAPSWYVRAKSRWKASDNLYGSEMRALIHEPIFPLGTNIGDIIDPYFMEKKHFFSRPFPTTGSLFSEVPIIGGILSGTIGDLIKPKKLMHKEFWRDKLGISETPESPYPAADPPPNFYQMSSMMNQSSGNLSMGNITSNHGQMLMGNNKNKWSNILANDHLSSLYDTAGLQGFMARTISEKVFGESAVIPTLETAGRMASQQRSYYDMNLGGLGTITESIRRTITKEDKNKYNVNEIPNTMPNWLPSQFLTGDPFSKILKGELRLPGDAYEKTRPNLKKTMPGRGSMIGAPVEHQVQYFTGLLSPLLRDEYDILESGTLMHEKVQDMLAAEGLLVQAEAFISDVKNDISGHVDAIITDGQGGGGKRALEIKSINNKAFAQLSGPKEQHVSQVNFYLNRLKLKKGAILYINRENPSEVKLYEMQYNHSLWEEDMEKLQNARRIAKQMMEKGVEDQFGFSYSWIDRLEILADVGPSTKQFAEAKLMVEEQLKTRMLSKDEFERYKKAIAFRQTRLRKYELNPIRFKGKVMTPDTEQNIQNMNEDIKAGAEYSLLERAAGSAWESFVNINTPIIQKFWGEQADPLEHYKRLKLYGREYKAWDEPYRGWLEPYIRSSLGAHTIGEGAIRWGRGAYVLGGPTAAFISGTAGSVYGMLQGFKGKLSDSAPIPGMINKQRNIESYFDAAEYEKFNRLASLSMGLTQKGFLESRNATLSAFNESENLPIADLFKATPYSEKPYISSWINTTNEDERKKILKYVPKDISTALKKIWRKNDDKGYTRNIIDNKSSEMVSGNPKYTFDASIIDPAANLDDIKLKVINNQSFNAHDFGLGWNEQLLRTQAYYDEIPKTDINESFREVSNNMNAVSIRSAIMEIIFKHGVKGSAQVYINPNKDINVANVTIRRDRSRAIFDALKFRRNFKV